MQHGIGGAAQRHIHGQGIHQCPFRHDLPGADILFDQLHHRHTGMLGKLDPGRVDRRDGAITL